MLSDFRYQMANTLAQSTEISHLPNLGVVPSISGTTESFLQALKAPTPPSQGPHPKLQAHETDEFGFPIEHSDDTPGLVCSTDEFGDEVCVKPPRYFCVTIEGNSEGAEVCYEI